MNWKAGEKNENVQVVLTTDPLNTKATCSNQQTIKGIRPPLPKN